MKKRILNIIYWICYPFPKIRGVMEGNYQKKIGKIFTEYRNSDEYKQFMIKCEKEIRLLREKEEEKQRLKDEAYLRKIDHWLGITNDIEKISHTNSAGIFNLGVNCARL